jgi:hypothetical protein
MNHQIKTTILSLVLLTAMFAFQNCSEVAFSSSGSKKAAGPAPSGEDSNTTPDDDITPTPPNEPPPQDSDCDDQHECECDCDNDDCHHHYPKRKVRSGKQIVAFEDLYPGTKTANVDFDYNDFVVQYKVKEHNKGRKLERIEVKFAPLAHLAGYDHKFLINLQEEDGRRAFRGASDAVLSIYNDDGDLVSTTAVDASKDIVIFDSVKALFKNGEPQFTAKLVVNVKGRTRARNKVDLRKYRVKLYVKNTGSLLEPVQNNLAHVNPENGAPYAMIVPGSYIVPAERQNIETIYPDFAKFRQYLLKKQADPNYVGTPEEIQWYLNIAADVNISQN